MWQSVRQRWPLIAVLTTILIVLLLTYSLRTVLLPFIIGLIFAYAILPVFSWFEKKVPANCRFRELRRIGLIALAYLIFVVLFGGVVTLLFFAIRNSFVSFTQNAPDYFSGAVETLNSWTSSIRDLFPEQLRSQVDQFIVDTGNSFWDTLKSGAINGVSGLPATLSIVLGLITLPVFLFYLLKDWDKLSSGIYSGIPSWATADFKSTISIIGVILGRYIRAQLVLGLVVGTLALLGLLALGIQLAPVLAILAGFGELIPVVGPLLTGITAVIVTLATDPNKAIWVAILFLGIQLLENVIIMPRIQGNFLKVHPAVVLVVLAIGTKVAGVWGLILAVPLTATIIAVYQQVIIGPPNKGEVPENKNQTDNSCKM